MNGELLYTQTSDTVRLHGLLTRSTRNPHPICDVLIFIHGVGSNFYQAAIAPKVAPVFNRQGISLLSVNTRGHDFVFSVGSGEAQRWYGSANELVSECVLDIDAWIAKCVDLGFKRIGLFGHSLGAIKSIYSQAYHPNPNVELVIAASPSGLSHTAFSASPRAKDYLRCLDWAKAQVESGNDATIGNVTFPFKLLMSAQTFFDKYGEEENYNFLRFIDQVDVPLLLTFGESEVNSTNPAFANLDKQAHPIVESNAKLDMKIFPETNHYYSGMQTELAHAAIRWMDSNV